MSYPQWRVGVNRPRSENDAPDGWFGGWRVSWDLVVRQEWSPGGGDFMRGRCYGRGNCVYASRKALRGLAGSSNVSVSRLKSFGGEWFLCLCWR